MNRRSWVLFLQVEGVILRGWSWRQWADQYTAADSKHSWRMVSLHTFKYKEPICQSNFNALVIYPSVRSNMLTISWIELVIYAEWVIDWLNYTFMEELAPLKQPACNAWVMGLRTSLCDISEIYFLESIDTVSGTEWLKMVCVTLWNLLRPAMSAVLTGK